MPGIQRAWSQTSDMCPTHVIHMIYTWLSYFWSLWATDKCEWSNWGRILPGIQWVLSQTRDTCPTCVIHVIYTWLSYFRSLWATDKCEGSNWGKILLGIQWACSRTCETCNTRELHMTELLLIPLSYRQVWGVKLDSNFTQNPLGMVLDMWNVSYTCLTSKPHNTHKLRTVLFLIC